MAEVSELVRFQRELKEEELLIVSMLAKIDKQLHALQVNNAQLIVNNFITIILTMKIKSIYLTIE